LKIIPFQLNSELVLKSISNPALKSKTPVYGAVPGEMIIIEEPLFSLNERFAGLPDGFTCAYLHGNHLYKFKSKFKKRLFKNVVGICYPCEMESVQIRSSTRIAVDIHTEVFLGTGDGTISCIMEDISEGGCRLKLPKLIARQTGSKLHLKFTLPDDQQFDNVECAVMNLKTVYDEKATVVGVSFSGPSVAVAKIQKFCKLSTFYLGGHGSQQ
jgi:c-di-GMP-binding flagellar brake protein YcgR